jgi:hypothetical protein
MIVLKGYALMVWQTRALEMDLLTHAIQEEK